MAGTIAAANPIVADGNGYWPQRYVSEDAKAVVTDADDVALYTLDPVPAAQGTGAAASAISFTPTIELPQTNVQDAIEAAGALAVSGFAAFGLGITGNAALLANLDATATGAGVYRFDGTTTGTYPTGVAAADTGMVELWRQAGATAMMELHHATSNRVFRRRLTSSVWGAWREVLNVNQATVEGDLAYRGASDWARLPKGTAGQVLRMNTGATAPEWVARIASAGAPVSTSGAGPFDVTGSLPADASRVILFVEKCSFAGAATGLFVRGRAAGSQVASGYDGYGSYTDNANLATLAFTTAFGVHTNQGSAAVITGKWFFDRVPGTNRWDANFEGMHTSSGVKTWANGFITFSGVLEGFDMLASTGSMDGGQVYATFER